MTPSAHVFIGECKAKSTIVGHFAAPVDENVDVVGIVEGFRSAPDDGERGGDVGSPGRVRELHVIAVDDVAEQLGAHVGHAALDVELTNEIGLHDELGNVLHFNFDALFDPVRHEDLGGDAGRRVDAWAESRAAADARANALC